MSKAKKAKVVKENKKRFGLRDFFYYAKTLLSNDRSIEVGLKGKIWVGIIIFVFAMLISIIPIWVRSATSSGSSFLSSSTNDAYYIGLSKFANESEYDILFEKDTSTASLVNKGTNEKITSEKTLVYTYKREAMHGEESYTNELEIYFVNGTNSIFTQNYETIYSQDHDGNTRTTSFILFGNEKIVSTLYYYTSSSTSVQTTGITGDFKNLKSLYAKDENTLSLINDVLLKTSEGSELTNSKTLSNYCEFIDLSYLNLRLTYTTYQTLINLAINAGMTLIVGFVFWLMTRRKTNPYKQTKWYKFFNIAFWISLCPAILSLILGFMMSGYEIILFVMVFGFRSVWLSMTKLKELPQQ